MSWRSPSREKRLFASGCFFDMSSCHYSGRHIAGSFSCARFLHQCSNRISWCNSPLATRSAGLSCWSASFEEAYWWTGSVKKRSRWWRPLPYWLPSNQTHRHSRLDHWLLSYCYWVLIRVWSWSVLLASTRQAGWRKCTIVRAWTCCWGETLARSSARLPTDCFWITNSKSTHWCE